MSACRLVVTTLALFALLRPAPAAAQAAQDALAQARTLYASADYEQALKLLEGVQDARESHYYRALCLIALGRPDAAEKQIAAVVMLDPMFLPSADEVSPRVAAVFTDTRRKLLPEIARKTFNDARRLFQGGEKEKARERFELTIRMLDDSLLDEGAELADLKLVASGFIDLQRSETQTPAAPPTPTATPTLAANSEASAAPARVATPVATTLPVTIEQSLPPWSPQGAAARRTYSGAVHVEIDETGHVTAARMEKPVHAAYDPLVLAAAQKWIYQPATLNGAPIPSEKTVEILLRPAQ